MSAAALDRGVARLWLLTQSQPCVEPGVIDDGYLVSRLACVYLELKAVLYLYITSLLRAQQNTVDCWVEERKRDSAAVNLQRTSTALTVYTSQLILGCRCTRTASLHVSARKVLRDAQDGQGVTEHRLRASVSMCFCEHRGYSQADVYDYTCFARRIDEDTG